MAVDPSDAEMAALRALLSAKPRPHDWAERRARIEEVTAGPLPDGVTLTPATLGGCAAEWSRTEGDGRGVVLYLHGGGYCSGSLASHRALVSRIPAAAGVAAVALAYPLAPEHPFPAALDSVLAAWDELRREVAAGEIVLAGDSAGAGLALAAMLRLRERGEHPACAWLLSPWSDLTMSGASMAQNAAADPLIHREYLVSLAGAYLAGHDPRDPLVSPLFADLGGLPPVLIQVGAAETLLDDAALLARALGAAGVDVRLEIVPKMIHAFPVWAPRLSAGRAALARAGAFVREHLFAS